MSLNQRGDFGRLSGFLDPGETNSVCVACSRLPIYVSANGHAPSTSFSFFHLFVLLFFVR